MLQTFQRKMERRILQVVWSDRRTEESSNKKGNQNKGTCGSGSQSEVGRRRQGGKNGSAQMDRHSVGMGIKSRREENGAREDPLSRHVLERSRRTVVTNRQKPVLMAWFTY